MASLLRVAIASFAHVHASGVRIHEGLMEVKAAVEGTERVHGGGDVRLGVKGERARVRCAAGKEHRALTRLRHARRAALGKGKARGAEMVLERAARLLVRPAADRGDAMIDDVLEGLGTRATVAAARVRLPRVGGNAR